MIRKVRLMVAIVFVAMMDANFTQLDLPQICCGRQLFDDGPGRGPE